MLSRFLRPACRIPSLLLRRSLTSPPPPPPPPPADSSSPLPPPPPPPPLSASSSPSSPSPDDLPWLRLYPLFPLGAKPGEVSVLWGIATPNTWLTEAVAKQIHPQIISSLGDLGIHGRIVLFPAFGDTARLSTEVCLAIQWEGIRMIYEPDWETELLGGMEMIEESPDRFQPGSYVVLICSGGSRLVRQAQVLKKKGYGVIVVVPPGETICEDLRLAVEHCIDLQ